MSGTLVAPLAWLGPFVVGAALVGCAARAGSVPMAGYRNRSTACVFGLRGVRIALDEATPDAINVRLTMCSDLATLRERARIFLAKQGVSKSSAGSDVGVREIELGHTHAFASVEDIQGGVRIRVVPAANGSVAAIRDEIQARIDRISSDNRCD